MEELSLPPILGEVSKDGVLNEPGSIGAGCFVRSSPAVSNETFPRNYEEEKPAPNTLKISMKSKSVARNGVSEGSKENITFSSDYELPYTADVLNMRVKRYRDYSTMHLKEDHRNRPMWVCYDGCIFLELFQSVSKQASDFLVTIAEPICRPELIHEFQITIFSLYAAISVGLSVDDLLNNLNKFSKNDLPESLVGTIRSIAQAFGKLKLVLRDNKYWVEANDKAELDLLLRNDVIRAARVKPFRPNPNVFSQGSLNATFSNHTSAETSTSKPLYPSLSTSTVTANYPNTQPEGGLQFDVGYEGYVTTSVPVLDTSQLAFEVTEKDATVVGRDAAPGDFSKPTGTTADEAIATTATPLQQVYAFEVAQEQIDDVKREALESMQRPLVIEYDFRKDKRNANLNCTLKCTTKIRYYQERALRKMFSNGRARSGIIVLPCGAGKTLTGITAACTMRKSVMILTTSAVAVEQWKKQLEEFTTIDPDYVKPLTSDYKSDLWPANEAGVLVSTYTMMAFSGKRSQISESILQQVRQRDWGLLIFDEVQYAPAPAFRKINESIRSHCKLGLTATLVREDDLIKDLQWLIGPKLYEANWLELQERGYLAKVTCQEVWCPMTTEFFREYIRCSHAKQRKLWVCNPNKMMVCEFLVKYHEVRGDKVIVFSDNVFALLHAAKALQRPFIYGKVSPAERMALLTKFKNEPNFNTIFLSKVGDSAIDIPCANVVIQISFNFASRRQEAQRLGRILRPKPRSEEGEFNAFFYSLVSKDTQEMVYADKRQQFIIDQGYSYTVLHSKGLPLHNEDLCYRRIDKQQELLREILISNDNEFDEDEDEYAQLQQPAPGYDSEITHVKRGLAAISGGASGAIYYENRSLDSGVVNAGFNYEVRRKVEKKENIANMHPLFRKFHSRKK